MGIDPGLATVGYGIINSDGMRHVPLDYGIISTKPDLRFPHRLKNIQEGVLTLIDQYHPDCIAIEELFFNTNVKTAINVAQARGAILLSVISRTENIYEYTPLQIKQAVVGYGRADKEQVQRMVQMLLKLEKIPRPDDAADALAVALCHGHTHKMAEQFRL